MSHTSDRLWGARFSSGPSDAMSRLSRSPVRYFDLLPYDVAGSRAHCVELHHAGILTADEAERIQAALVEIDQDFRAGSIEPIEADEDVHTFLERLLTERLGALGGKLRAGRSRNDQAANDMRLLLRDRIRQLAVQIHELMGALAQQAQVHLHSVVPGFTHLQQAQPIVFGHQLLAHAQSLLRDVQRIIDWDRRFSLSPLGAAAMAGSAVAKDGQRAAKVMGFEGACENSIDAVASRDHVAEFLFIAGMVGVNLSRLGEEVCLWTSRQFQWVVLDDGYATGSSIMPQKKNPDIAELTRGKSGRLIGNLTGLMSTLKAQPLSYNRDLGEDKHQVLDALETLDLVLPAMAGMIATMTVNVDEMRRQAPLGFTLATEIADWLSMRDVSFREAHEITGQVVRLCEQEGIELSEISAAQLQSVDSRLEAGVLDSLTLEAALEARDGYGGTAPEQVGSQLERLRVAIQQQQSALSDYRGPRVD
ncbi:argininosuccinate lyase [Salinicola corii]|uniref:Argininosuccinate lyase n=1 Tax=Salinicola corii TaxID=2606937 RepID=A0A640W7P4_9GAMM|nr:argininosuccinate lyase [Salinicola corii]